MEICLQVLAQGEKYRDEILAAAKQAVTDGSPVNRPVWWVDPDDAETYSIDDGNKEINNSFIIAKYWI